MVDNIKAKIAEESQKLFITKGYDKVTMRQIAAACGISVGNLTYYYPHKEDLLMEGHDEILNVFLERVLPEGEENSDGTSDLSGLQGYFTVECAFLYRILNDPPIARLYGQVINVPTLRPRYDQAHYALFLRFMPDEAANKREWDGTVAMCALEYELSDEGILTENFSDSMESIFQVRMLFAGKDPDLYKKEIKDGVADGISLAKELEEQGET